MMSRFAQGLVDLLHICVALAQQHCQLKELQIGQNSYLSLQVDQEPDQVGQYCLQEVESSSGTLTDSITSYRWH